MAGAQVTIAAAQVDAQRLGFQSISLTEFASTAECQISAGSKVEIQGALYQFPADESITGWGGIGASNAVYILLTTAGASVTASFTTTAPTWSVTAQGWYTGAARVIGGLYKDAGSLYTLKWLYEEKQIASVKRYGNGTVNVVGVLTGEVGIVAGAGNATLLKKVVNIGDWNMDTTATIAVAHGIADHTKIIGISVSIRDDGDITTSPLNIALGGIPPGTVDVPQGAWRKGGTYGGTDPNNIGLWRLAGGYFDTASYDATSYNRGWIIIEYTP
ncbi:MAG TPA: hypothetical protein VJ553_03300 [Candidatus Paceibacterota bacterium]|nr:hypothetical protein [Candidatus Paceibacterota bacterium]